MERERSIDRVLCLKQFFYFIEKIVSLLIGCSIYVVLCELGPILEKVLQPYHERENIEKIKEIKLSILVVHSYLQRESRGCPRQLSVHYTFKVFCDLFLRARAIRII